MRKLQPMIICALLCCLCANSGAECADVDRHVSMVPTLISDSPRFARGTLGLTEMWRIDSSDEDAPVVGVVAGAEFDSLGNLYLLDGQLLAVHLISATGKLEKTFGGRGEGPGRFTSAVALTRFPNGDLGVLQPMPPKLVVYAPDGTPKGDLDLGIEGVDYPRVMTCKTSTDGILAAGFSVNYISDKRSIQRDYFMTHSDCRDCAGRCLMTKRVVWTYGDQKPLQETDLDFPTNRMAIDGNGHICIATDRDDYRIVRCDPSGTVIDAFGRVLAPCARSDQHRIFAEYFLRGATKRFPPDRKRTICKTDPAIWRLVAMLNGTLWVLPGCDENTDEQPRYPDYDVFDSGGAYLRTVGVPVEGDPAVDVLVLSEHGYALMIRNLMASMLASRNERGPRSAGGGDGGVRIICYRIDNLRELCMDHD